MINHKIKVFFLVFIGLIVIFSAVHSDERKPKNDFKKSTAVHTKTLTSNSSNSILKKKKIEEKFLGELNVNGIGLISVASTKFPEDLWSISNEKVLAEKLDNMRKLSLSSTKKTFKRLLLVDAKPPLNSIGMKNMGYLFLLSRIDQLINLGAIDEAEEILNFIQEPSIDLMKRKIEVASLTGRLSKTCNLANKYPSFKGLLQFKIICLVRKNDWQAAALAFTVGSSLRQFDEKEKQLLLNYLDPDIESNYSTDVDIDNLSPMDFYLIHGKKALIPPEIIPSKYAYAFSEFGMEPEIRIKSMEQLALNHVVSANRLFNLYRLSSHQDKNKSNNVTQAVIELDRSFKSNSQQKRLIALYKAIKVFQKKKLLAHLSNEYTDQLKNLHYSDDKRLNELAIALLSLTDSVTNKFFSLRSTNSDINCLIDIKKRIFINYETDTDLCELVKDLNIEIIKKSFPTKRKNDVQMEKGLILLESLNLLEKGLSTDFKDVKLSLSMITKIGLIDLVNEISTELIALNVLKKMVL